MHQDDRPTPGLPAGFAEHLELLREADRDPFEGAWKRAAEHFDGLAARGEDVAPAIALLEKRFADSHQVPAMEAIARVLVRHHLRCGTVATLVPLVRSVTYADTVVLGALRGHTRGGKSFEAMLPLLLELAPGSRYQVFQVWHAHIGRSEKRLARVVTAAIESPACRRLLPAFVRDSVISDLHERMSLAPAVAALGTLLGTPSSRDEAASVLAWVVEADIDIASIAPALETCVRLEEASDEVRARAAYALGFSRVAAGDWARLDGLLASPDADVRGGAVRALGVSLLAKKRGGAEAHARLAAALLDAAAPVRALARALLGKVKSVGALSLGEPVLSRLLGALEDPQTGEGVAEVLCYHAEAGAETAEKLLAGLAGLTGERAARLRAVCEGVLAKTHEPSCDLCRQIPWRTSTTYPSDVPEGFARLVPAASVETAGNRTCPHCGARYRYSYSEEWRSPSDGMGIDYDIDLQRLTPPEVWTRSSKAPEYELALARCRSNLDHPERYLREDAARALMLDGREREDVVQIAALLGHVDVAVRRRALETLHEEWRKAEPPVPVEPLIPCLTERLADADAGVRSLAAEAVCAYHADRSDPAGLHALLACPDPILVAKVFEALRRHPELDATSFRSPAGALADHPCESVRSQVRLWLREEAKRPGAGPGIVEIYLRQLSSRDAGIAAEAASALNDLDWPGAPQAPEILKRMTEVLTVERVRYHAFETLDRAVRQGLDISSAFPRLLEVAGNRADTSGSRPKALGTLGGALPAAARRGVPLTDVVVGLAGLLADTAEQIRGGATGCYTALLTEKVAIDEALPAILAMLTRPRVSYVESYFAETIAGLLVERGDWPRLRELLAATSEVSGATSRVLAKAASRGLDLTPVLEALLACLVAPSWYTRDGAAGALIEHAQRHPESAEEIGRRLAGQRLDSESAEIRRLLASLG